MLLFGQAMTDMQLNSIWFKLIKDKHLKNNILSLRRNIFQIIDILLEGLWFRILDGNNIKFWYDNRIENSPLFDRIHQNMYQNIQGIAKVCEFITSSKTWDTDSVINIINTINALVIPLPDIQDSIKRNFTRNGEFSIKEGYLDKHLEGNLSTKSKAS